MFWGEPVRAHLLRLYVIVTATLLPFVVWPGIDLAVARLFHVPGEGFPLSDVDWLMAVRNALWDVSIAGFVAAIGGLVWSSVRPSRVPARVWGLIVALFLLGPVLLTHFILKEEWHRARPADILAFGGDARFTGPFAQAGGCVGNCSFVSGEVSGSVALALAVIWLVPALGRVSHRRWAALAAVAMAVTTAALRMAMGRHFLSDCLFAALFMFAIWSLLSRALPPGWRPLAALGIGRGNGDGGAGPAPDGPDRREADQARTSRS